MNKLNLYGLCILFSFFSSGCTNQNNLSLGTIQDEKNVQYKENEYNEILAEKDILANSDEDMKNKLKFITQNCVKRFWLYESIYPNERISSNAWFDITENNISIEHNVRNFIKEKSDLKNENLNLGGRHGNRIFKISLPYKFYKINDTTYKLTIYNNENIKVVESMSNITNKPYEPTIFNIDIDKFKDKINGIAKCI